MVFYINRTSEEWMFFSNSLLHMSGNKQTCATTRSYFFFKISVECGGSTYGTDCNESCGHCVNNETCYHVNGSCANGCAAGWENDVCKKSKHLLIQFI